MTLKFKIGKLYVCGNKGWNSTYEKKVGKLQIYPAHIKQRNTHYIDYHEVSMDETIMIVELLYINSTKSHHISENTFRVFNEWHAKIIANDTIGYVFISEADWIELT